MIEQELDQLRREKWHLNGASLRTLEDASRFIESVGPSGHFLSKYYDAFQQDWKDVRHRKMRMDRSEIETGAIGRLRLSPIANR